MSVERDEYGFIKVDADGAVQDQCRRHLRMRHGLGAEGCARHGRLGRRGRIAVHGIHCRGISVHENRDIHLPLRAQHQAHGRREGLERVFQEISAGHRFRGLSLRVLRTRAGHDHGQHRESTASTGSSSHPAPRRCTASFSRTSSRRTTSTRSSSKGRHQGTLLAGSATNRSRIPRRRKGSSCRACTVLPTMCPSKKSRSMSINPPSSSAAGFRA